METDIRITIYADISVESDKNEAIEKIKSAFKHLLDLWDMERMTSNVNYNNDAGISLEIKSYQNDTDD